MNEHCSFCKDYKCIKQADYELLRYELEEANELCHCLLYTSDAADDLIV